jgi:thiol-disulfide isomerase/thioredoxin
MITNHKYQCYAPLRMLLAALMVLLSPRMAWGASSNPAGGDHDYVVGSKVRKVVTLNSQSFRQARKDAANPVFLYMFSAYWCGHCKRLAPILEVTAPQVAGRLALAKIDCTESDSKQVCDEFKIRGYPTLKFSLDGEMFDYTGGRTEEDLLTFADRMSRPPMALVESIDQAIYHASEETFGHGVVFLCHDPVVALPAATATVGGGGASSTLHHLLPNSPLLKACQQAARKEMAHAHFLALSTKVDTSSLTGILPDEPHQQEDSSSSTPTKKKGGFVCRLEANVPARCLLERDVTSTLQVDTIQEFVQVQNVATLTELGPHNFHRIGRLGRPLVIGVADSAKNEDAVIKLKHDLRSFAIHGPPELASEKYYFGYMDGVRWAKFLQQFDIHQDTTTGGTKTTTPQVFVLNVPKRLYWQDASFQGKSIKEFLTAIENGIIPAKESGGVRGAGFIGRIANGFWSWLPWSLLLILAMAAGVVILLVPDVKEMVLSASSQSKKNRGAGAAAAVAGGSTSLSQSQTVDPLLGKKQQ